MDLLRTKSVEQSIKDTEEPEHKLNCTLGPLGLTVFGVLRGGLGALAGALPDDSGHRRRGRGADTFVPLTTLAELVNIGTLFAFIVVSLGVIVLRRTQPDLDRAFRAPMVPLLPILSILASLWLMLNLATDTWLRFGVWMLVGFFVYFLYSKRHSRLETGESAPGAPPASSSA